MQQQPFQMHQQPAPMYQQPALMHQQPAPVPAPQPSVTFLYTAEGIPVQVVNTNSHNGASERYKSAAARSMGTAQVILGILIIICQIVVTSIDAEVHEGFCGFWASVMFIIAGSFGIQSSKTKSNWLIIVTMILSTIAAVLSVAVITQGILGASIESSYYHTRHCTYDKEPHYKSHCANYWTAHNYAAVTFFSIMAILGFVEGIVAIIAASLCCHSCCSKSASGIAFAPGVPTVPMGSGFPVAVSYQANQAQYPVSMARNDAPQTPPPEYQEKVPLP